MPLHKFCATISQRWVIVLAVFLGFFITIEVQVCLSVAIIQMVIPKNHTIDLNKNDSYTPKEIDVSSFNSTSITNKGMKFDWDEKTQGLILSAFSWGATCALILGGPIVSTLGAKRTMALNALSIAFLTLLLPISVQWYGAVSLIAVRFLTGFSGNIVHPAMMKLFSQWIPEDERSFAASWAYSGGTIGSIIGIAASGAIIERFGWPTIFYVYGAFGIFVFFVQCVICYDSPSKHPCISKSEMELLKRKLQNSQEYVPSPPWHLIIRSKPIWALLIALIGITWCQMIVANYTPMFMNSVLKLKLETNGYVSSISHVGSLILNLSLSRVTDRLIANKIISTSYARKTGNTVCSVCTGLVFVIVTYVNFDPTLIVILYVFASIMFSIHHISTMVNALDLTPNYASSIQGILMGVSWSIGSMSTYIAAWMMPTQTINEWRSVLFMMLIVGAITNLFFIIFGKAEVQEWNDPKMSKHKTIIVNDQVKDNSELGAML